MSDEADTRRDDAPNNDGRETSGARSPVEAAKHAARAHARTARGAIDALAAASAAEDAARLVLELPEFAHVGTVLAYGASPEEIDPAVAVQALRARGVRIVYPRVEEPGTLGLHLVEAGQSLQRGMFGILEPSAEWPRVPAEDIDAVIVPGVAFDEGCWRLGYGGGYYDRLLPTLRFECARIGFAYDQQILETIPAEEHDVALDAIVTPTRVIRRAG